MDLDASIELGGYSMNEVGEPDLIDLPAGVALGDSEALSHRPLSLIDQLAPKDRERVRAHGTERIFERGEILFRQNDPHDGIVIVEEGLVRSFYSAPSGREITLAYWLAGNFVGGPDIFGGGRHVWSAAAAKRTRVTFLPGEGLRNLAREVPDLALGIIDALSYKARCYSSLAQMLGTRSLSQRLSHVLLHLARIYGVEHRDGIAIAAAFTHSEIANLIGATRQWVTISLNRLQASGVLTQKRGLMLIHRPEALLEAGIDEED